MSRGGRVFALGVRLVWATWVLGLGLGFTLWLGLLVGLALTAGGPP